MGAYEQECALTAVFIVFERAAIASDKITAGFDLAVAMSVKVALDALKHLISANQVAIGLTVRLSPTS